MTKLRGNRIKLVSGIAATALLALSLPPAIAAVSRDAPQKKSRISVGFSTSNFTPSIADPALAAEFARRGLQPGQFRFTPATAQRDKGKSIRVAIRAGGIAALRSPRGTPAALAETSAATTVTAITPTAYNLGASVGWKRFALSSDLAKAKAGVAGETRERAVVGVTYDVSPKAAGRLSVGAERSSGGANRAIPTEDSVDFDLGASYKVARNLAVTGGVKYKIQNDRLQPLQDNRRDSQAVYVGTAFRF